MGQLDEADAQYKLGLEIDPNSAAIKAEAQLVGMIRSNLDQGRRCLQENDARSGYCQQTLSKCFVLMRFVCLSNLPPGTCSMDFCMTNHTCIFCLLPALVQVSGLALVDTAAITRPHCHCSLTLLHAVLFAG